MSTLDDDAVASALGGLDWEREGDELVKTVQRKDFAQAMRFVNAVADAAEAANHHPDISISWNTVGLRLSTHSAGGITQKDLDLARRIDELV
jgi:4a-hydroxytetrahydrobiopterin dehydratase